MKYKIGDILEPKVGVCKIILTRLDNLNGYSALIDDGRTISDDDIFFLRYYKLYSSNNGSIKDGMLKFMEMI
jgi:hypothetical protein